MWFFPYPTLIDMYCTSARNMFNGLTTVGANSCGFKSNLYLSDNIRSIASTRDLIGDVRGSGLFIAIELVDDRQSRIPATSTAGRVVNALRDAGILTGSIGPDKNILKLRPPMVFTKENADFFLERFDGVLSAI